jgi:acyl-CoA thioester hydrolase
MNRDEPSVPAAFRYRVYWEDTDAGGVVYHARYLHFLERARSDWLSALGIVQTALRDEHGIVFAVTRADIRFIRPARLEDELAVSVRVQRPGRARLDFSQTIERGGERLAEASIGAACVDAHAFRPRRMPPGVLAAVAAAAD